MLQRYTHNLKVRTYDAGKIKIGIHLKQLVIAENRNIKMRRPANVRNFDQLTILRSFPGIQLFAPLCDAAPVNAVVVTFNPRAFSRGRRAFSISVATPRPRYLVSTHKP